MIRFKGYIILIFLILLVQVGNGQHFRPVYSGNPYNPMNILVTNITVDNQRVEVGDEIGVFDGNICVGASKYKGEDIIGISVAMDDPLSKEKDGFKFGNPISFRIWKHKIELEYFKVETNFNPFFDTAYVPLGTAIVSLKTSIPGQRPQIFPNQIFAVKENAVQNSDIGQLKVDFSIGKLSFEILQAENESPFSIDTSGTISLNDPSSLDYNKIQSYNVPVRVFSNISAELSDTSTFIIEVLRVPPSIASLKNDTAVVGSSYKQVVKVTDASSKSLSVIPSNLPTWLSIRLETSNEIVFEGTPSIEDIGKSEVSFMVSDNTSLVQKAFYIETIRNDVKPDITLNNNPTTGPFKLTFDQFEESDAEVEVTIKTMSGNVVYKNILKNSGNNFSLDIDLAGNVKTIYLVEVRAKNVFLTKKLLLQ